MHRTPLVDHLKFLGTTRPTKKGLPQLNKRLGFNLLPTIVSWKPRMTALGSKLDMIDVEQTSELGYSHERKIKQSRLPTSDNLSFK
jgi:hypothetical protein